MLSSARTLTHTSSASETGSQTAAVLPTFAIVPGAWHSPAHWDLVVRDLNRAGYPTSSKRLPGVNSPTPTSVSTTTDALFIRNNVLLPLIANGKDVILVAHSYGGMPSGAAAAGLSKAERTAAGQPGGIVGLVWVAALIAHPGDSLKALAGGQYGSWVIIDVRNPVTLSSQAQGPKAIFYGDVAPPVAEHAISQLMPQSENVLSTPTGTQAWAEACYDGRRAYAHTLLDQCIPSVAQSGMLAASAVAWDVHSFDTSHSPFLSQPAQLSQTLISLARKWQ
ncbi:hypothetical protein MMC27_007072 [Xylographa pallens]|nr:hypothetical protein [Xylographa pallens]